MDIREELKSAGTYPTGPCSAWPEERNIALIEAVKPKQATKVTATAGQMAKGLLRTAGAAITSGRVSKEVRDARYKTCQNCPLFLKDSKRCSDCGCFMEAKTWVNGNKAVLCPKDRWLV